MEAIEEKEALIFAINDVLDLIDRANARIEAWQSEGQSASMVEQWKDLKKRYSMDLIELLKEYNLSLELVEA